MREKNHQLLLLKREGGRERANKRRRRSRRRRRKRRRRRRRRTRRRRRRRRRRGGEEEQEEEKEEEVEEGKGREGRGKLASSWVSEALRTIDHRREVVALRRPDSLRYASLFFKGRYNYAWLAPVRVPDWPKSWRRTRACTWLFFFFCCCCCCCCNQALSKLL